MADNVISDGGDALGPTFASDDIAGVHYPRSKVTWGPDGTANDTDDAAGKRLPVNLAETVVVPVNDNGGSLTVDGTVAVTHTGLTELAAAINASSQMDVNLAASAATVSVSNAGLTELAAAINASNQLDMNIAASAVSLTVSSHPVTNVGTFPVQAAQSGTWNVGTVTTVTNVVHVDDNAGSLTVDGTVAVTNAGLTELAAAVNASSQMDVNIAASGATLTVASHAVTNAGTFATQASQAGTWTVQPGNTANTTPWLASIHDGTTKATVADLTNSNPLHVAIVDADGTQVASFGGGTQYTEDAVGAANPVGTVFIAIRDDARGGSLTTTDGDNVALRGTNAGELYVKHVDAVPVTDNGGTLTVDGTVAVTHGALTELATAINASAQMDVNIAASGATLTVAAHAVTNAGTFAVQVDGAALTALQVIDNPVVVDDAAFTPATTSVMMAGFEFDDATPDSVNEGDAGAARMSANRNIYTTLRDAAGNERGANVNASSQLAVSVDNTVTVASHAVTNAGTFAVQATLAAGAAAIAKAEDAASADLDVGVPSMAVRKATPVNTSGTDGDYEMMQMSAGRLWVDPSGVTLTVASHAVTNAGTFATQAASAGDIAHDAADSGNPLKIGAKATTAITGITAVVNNDRTQLYAGTDGILLVRENANLESNSRGTAAITDGSSTSVIAAAGANIKTYITDVIICNSSATYVTVDIRDGTAGSVMATFPAPATGGVVHRVGTPFAGTANTAVAADPSAAATTVTVTLLGFKSLI